MAARRNRQVTSGRSRSSYGMRTESHGTGRRGMYVYGSAAPQYEEVPERRYQPGRKRRRKVYPSPKPVAMPSISIRSFFFLLGMVAVMLTVCFYYLHVQSGITNMKNEIVSLQSEIAQAREDNSVAYQEVMDSVDLAQVYEIATGELGMTQAVDNQVYKYNNKKSDMVRQYGDIPSAKK